jgi:hypothetical protein
MNVSPEPSASYEKAQKVLEMNNTDTSGNAAMIAAMRSYN